MAAGRREGRPAAAADRSLAQEVGIPKPTTRLLRNEPMGACYESELYHLSHRQNQVPLI